MWPGAAGEAEDAILEPTLDAILPQMDKPLNAAAAALGVRPKAYLAKCRYDRDRCSPS